MEQFSEKILKKTARGIPKGTGLIAEGTPGVGRASAGIPEETSERIPERSPERISYRSLGEIPKRTP